MMTLRFFNGLTGLAVLAGLVMSLNSGVAAAVGSARDCDANAVIRCGAMTPAEVSQNFNNQGVASVFNCFGISPQAVNQLGTTAVDGFVTTRNTVVVNGRVVATNAMTAGRQNIAGSSQISCGGNTFFMRPPSVSFASSRLSAMVVMKNDRFAFAILKSCGNPVKARPVVPVVKKTPAPTPQAPTPAPTPPAAPVQQQQQQQTVVVNNTQPVVEQQQQATPAQTQTQTQATPAAQLPNTGPGPAAAGISLLATLTGTVGHLIYQRRKTS